MRMIIIMWKDDDGIVIYDRCLFACLCCCRPTGFIKYQHIVTLNAAEVSHLISDSLSLLILASHCHCEFILQSFQSIPGMISHFILSERSL